MKYDNKTIPSSTFSIKEIPQQELPREKLISHGPLALTEAELLAILLRTGTKNLHVIDTAKHLLKQAGGLSFLMRKTWKELSNMPGIGKVKAITLISAFELARRADHINHTQRISFQEPKSIANYYRPRLRDESQEVFIACYVDNSNKKVFDFEVSKGTPTQTIIDTNRILKQALLHEAQGIFLIHNHPSGNSKPSNHDIITTKRIQKGAELLNINLLDHIIIAGNNYSSLKSEGLF